MNKKNTAFGDLLKAKKHVCGPEFRRSSEDFDPKSMSSQVVNHVHFNIISSTSPGYHQLVADLSFSPSPRGRRGYSGSEILHGRTQPGWMLRDILNMRPTTSQNYLDNVRLSVAAFALHLALKSVQMRTFYLEISASDVDGVLEVHGITDRRSIYPRPRSLHGLPFPLCRLICAASEPLKPHFTGEITRLITRHYLQ